MITIRKAKLTDLDRMMEIYARAKRFMDSTGNTTQWEIGYPTRKMIQDDIENGFPMQHLSSLWEKIQRIA